MRAARRFVDQLRGLSPPPAGRLRCELYGSLAATGKGHGTDRAIALGFLGHDPRTLDPDVIAAELGQLDRCGGVEIAGGARLAFDRNRDLVFHRRQSLPLHPNGLHFQLLDDDEQPLHEQVIYSVGGGTIRTEAELREGCPADDARLTDLPYPFRHARELLRHCAEHGLDIAGVALANELALRSMDVIESHLESIWQAMQDCVGRGLRQTGVLPGGLKVPRRAAAMAARLHGGMETGDLDPLQAMDWVNAWALAVNEENAGGGRVVTAPTNGAAGILPAVMHYACHFVRPPGEHPMRTFLLTAGAVGWLYRANASISGADVGCQGEVGVACSMAAAGLAAVLGASPRQVENAAEIGMEHNLGLTCDPIGGLVQIPCIERNAMGAVKAINASRMAMRGDGKHKVSLDKVIRTMRDTGRDMQDKYKETSRGGLAVNVIEC